MIIIIPKTQKNNLFKFIKQPLILQLGEITDNNKITFFNLSILATKKSLFLFHFVSAIICIALTSVVPNNFLNVSFLHFSELVSP